MNEKKSNAPIIAIVVIVALALIGVPCLLGALFVGVAFMRQGGDMPQPPPTELNSPATDDSIEGNSGSLL